jgi:hypothetical protein
VHQVGVFISHSWKYSEHYDKLSEWIFAGNWNSGGVPIHFVDHSVPKDDPIHYAPNEATLRAAIFSKIAQADVVVIPTGMYAHHSKWIGKEIEGSHQFSRPILGVNLWGSQKAASVVGAAARETVGWTKDSVVGGIWRLRSGG